MGINKHAARRSKARGKTTTARKRAQSKKKTTPTKKSEVELEKARAEWKSLVEVLLPKGGPPPKTDKEWADAPIPPPRYFLGEQVWHSQNIAMFVMKTDAGKTNWTVALALALAYGKSFCDWVTVQPCKVLYIEGETSMFNMQRVIRQQRIALDIPDDVATKNFVLITPQTCGDIPELVVKPKGRANDNAGRELERLRAKIWLFKLIRKEKPDFIVFDSIQSLAPSMVSTTASGWTNQLMKPIAVPLNHMGIGQLWLHHPPKDDNTGQHGTGARSWGLSMELQGIPLRNRGICFNLFFPGKKKDDLGDNDDFNARSVVFNRDEHGVSRWVVGLPVMMAEPVRLEAHRPNKSAEIAMKVFHELVEAKMATGKFKNEYDVWLSAEIAGEWCIACLKAGISGSDARKHQVKAFVRARNHLIETDKLERRLPDGLVRLFPPMPPPDAELLMDSATAGTA